MNKEQKQGIQTALQNVMHDIKNEKTTIEKIKKAMSKHNVLAGEVVKASINPDTIKEMSIAKLILIYIETYNATKDKRLDTNSIPLYNPELKAKFLNSKYNANTQLTYMRIFENSAKSEKERGKDLYEFNMKDIESVLYELEPLTKSASHVNGRILTVYIDWCINELDLRISNDLKKKEMNWFDIFVDKDVQLYLNESTLRKIEDDCVNYQDAVILRLLFEGVQGKKNLAEIRNIQYNDINWDTNEVTLYDYDNNDRTVTLTDRAMFLMDKAFEPRPYIKKNGTMEENDHIGMTTELVNNNYLIRTSITRTDQKDRPVDKMVVYRRIKTISETNRLGIGNLTVKNIVRSGIIYEGKKRLGNIDEELTKKDYLQICDIYNITNWYPVKKYCNLDIIKKVYGSLNVHNSLLV